MTSRSVAVGSAEFFFSEPSEILPGFKHTLAPESCSQKRGVLLERENGCSRNWGCADVARCVDTGAMRVPGKLTEEGE